MRRRRLLWAGAFGVGVAVTGGLGRLFDRSSDSEPAAAESELPAVYLEHRRHEDAVRRTTLRVWEGRVETAVGCWGDEKRSRTRSVPAEEYERTRRVVADLDPSGWRDRYVGTDSVIKERITLMIDGRPHETVLNAGRLTPEGASLLAGVERLRAHLVRYREAYPTPGYRCDYE